MSSDNSDKKVCRYCGRLTSAQANFCWYCARELEARPERPLEEPKPTRINWLALLLAAVVLAGVILLFIAN